MTAILPWQLDAFALARASIARGAHALLVAGARGIGKRELAIELARSHLCASVTSDGMSCGSCESCRWFAAGTHPDFLLIEPILADDAAEEGMPASQIRSRPIGVDQIRPIGEMLSLSAHRDAGKVVLITPANSLNVAASNALLKSLEEPPAGSVFVLVADRPAMLLATVRSRCQLVPVRLTDPPSVARWLATQNIDEPELCLALCGGAPMAAVDIANDSAWQNRKQLLTSLTVGANRPFELANIHRDLAPALVLSWLQQWSYDLLMVRMRGSPRYNVDLGESLDKLAPRADPVRVTRLHRRLLQMQRHATHSLNPRLFLEQMLVECTDAVHQGK